MVNKLFPYIICLLMIGCAHSVHQVHMSDYDPYTSIKGGKWIKSQAEQHVILGFVGNTDYVNVARADLIKQCPNRNIKGIMTRYSTSLGFFNWKNIVHMEAMCVR